MTRKRVLFVDDDANVIDGLRRMLRAQRNKWDMNFAASGAEALAQLAAVPHDVIVTDMQMAEMDGATLLERVIQAYPRMARIILSSHPGEESTRKAINLAHQFLSKPVDAATLVEAVTRACAASQGPTDSRILDIVGACHTLPSLPTLYIEMTQAANSDRADSQTVANIIGKDMAMSAKLLKLVNSSFFGIGRRISSIAEAVTLLGIIRIKALVLSDHVFGKIAPKRPLSRFSIENLWNHSCEVAEVARLISKAEGQSGDRPDQAFTGGVLHDIGILLLASHHPDMFDAMIAVMDRDDRAQCEVEKETFGLTHEDIGNHLLTFWGLPPRIVEAVGHHHHPGQIEYEGLCATTCIHVADAILSGMGRSMAGVGYEPRGSSLDLDYLKRIGLDHRVGAWTDLASSVVDRVMAVSA